MLKKKNKKDKYQSREPEKRLPRVGIITWSWSGVARFESPEIKPTQMIPGATRASRVAKFCPGSRGFPNCTDVQYRLTTRIL